MWLKQPGRQVGPGAPDLQALCSGPAHILWPLGFWGFFCAWVWVGWKHKAAFFPCWGPLINFSPDLWVFIFPLLFLFFLSCFHPFLELGGISFWRSGSLIRWVEWIVWDWRHTLNAAQRVSKRMTEIHGMQMNRNLNNAILKMIWRAGL